jgi:hypothetical protein
MSRIHQILRSSCAKLQSQEPVEIDDPQDHAAEREAQGVIPLKRDQLRQDAEPGTLQRPLDTGEAFRNTIPLLPQCVDPTGAQEPPDPLEVEAGQQFDVVGCVRIAMDSYRESPDNQAARRPEDFGQSSGDAP